MSATEIAQRRAVSRGQIKAYGFEKIWADGINDRFKDMLRESYGGLKNLKGEDYDQLAEAVQDIGKQLTEMLPVPIGGPDGPAAERVREMIAARLGLALGRANPDFDSWRWAAACKGEKE